MAKLSKILLLNPQGRGKAALCSSVSGRGNRLWGDNQPCKVHGVIWNSRDGVQRCIHAATRDSHQEFVKSIFGVTPPAGLCPVRQWRCCSSVTGEHAQAPCSPKTCRSCFSFIPSPPLLASAEFFLIHTRRRLE